MGRAARPQARVRVQPIKAGGSSTGASAELVTPERGDWKSQLQPASRERIINKIMETAEKHLSFSGEEALLFELKTMVVRFEENVYTAATTQDNYLRRISLKMLMMETKRNPDTSNQCKMTLIQMKKLLMDDMNSKRASRRASKRAKK